MVWKPPYVSTYDVERCDGVGTPKNDGTYLKFRSTGYTTSVVLDGVETNKMVRQYRYRVRDENWPPTWTTISNNVDAATWLDNFIFGGGSISIANAYEVQFRITDSYTTGDGTLKQVVVPVSTVVMAWSKTGVGWKLVRIN